MRSKQKRFAENADRSNVIEPGKPFFKEAKGKWRSDYFKNQQPICLELACGKGEYTIGLARIFPETSFIGMDMKGDRIWSGSSVALNEGLNNVAFLRTPIQYMDEFFEKDELDEIWIVFPDPRPRDRDEKHRLTCPAFLDLYKNYIKLGGWVRLKTDNTGLYEYTLEVLKARTDISNLEFTEDLYHSPLHAEHYGIVTRFENKFFQKGERIKYLKFKFVS